MTKEQVTEKIFQTLQSQRFADWYNNGNFDLWITGEYPITTEQIREEISKLFHLE